MTLYLEKIKSFISKHPIVDYIVIAVIITILCFFYCNHFTLFLADRGRELLLPEEILNGKIPYKDITLIYFPTAYYINALIYKILGVSLNSFVISQGIVSIGFMFLNYSCARFFLNRKESMLLSMLIISSCIFSNNDLFAFISPYSYARAYGIAVYTLCIFLLIKLFRTDNLKYLYVTALLSGFCFIFKFEFFIVYILLGAALFLYKRLKFVQYLKIFLLTILFPLILLAVLYIQGVSINDLTNSVIFGFKFSKTIPMTKFLTESGMYPTCLITNFKTIFMYTSCFVGLILSCFAALKLDSKYKKTWIIPCATIIIWRVFYYQYTILRYWILLPLLILIFLCFKYKELYSENKDLLLFIIASLLIAQRCFFLLSLCSYGIYSFPLIIISFYIIIKKYFPSELFKIQTEKLVNYVIVVILFMYLINICVKISDTPFPIETKKGTIYTDLFDYNVMDSLLTYINYKIDKDSSLLVLPEGHIINYLTDIKTNLKCHMMDRLYHDAYGEVKARDMIAATKVDYIIVLDQVKLHDFYKPYLYKKPASLSARYIYENYSIIKIFHIHYAFIKVLKRKAN